MPRILRSLSLCLLFLALAGTLSLLHGAEPVKVQVQGVEDDILKNVEAALAPPDGLVRDGTVDRLWLDHYVSQAEAKAKTALEPFGYYRPTVTATLAGSEKDGFTLNVTVATGDPVRLSEVHVGVQGAGASEETVQAAAADFPLKAGDLLLHRKYEEGKGALLSRAHILGYLDAACQVHEVRVDPAAGTARINLLLETGPRYRFGMVTFEGAPLYSDALLRRYLAFKSGAPFSYDRLGRTQSNFTGSGYFREVSILPVKDEAVDHEVPVRVLLKPAPGRTLRPGIGYGTDTGFRGSLSYKELNLFHRGHVLTVEATAAEKFQGIGAGYVIPSLTNLRSMTGFQVNLQREDITSYLSTLAALEANKTVSFGSGRLGTVYLRFHYEEFVTGLENSSARLVMPGLRFSGRRYDNLVRPADGYNYSLELRGTHHYLGSDTAFIQGIAEGAHLLPLPWRLSLGTRGKVGATWQDDPLAELPATIRFYAGGDTSVRGYAYKSLGPTDASGEVVGGQNLLQGSVELERALFDSWGVSLFYDAGNAFRSFTDFRLYQGAGVGLHYYTKVGGLNLSVARQIDVPDPGFRVHFTIGFQP